MTFLVLVNFNYSWHLQYFSASSHILSILITYQIFWGVHISSWISTNSFFFIYLPAFGLSFQLTEFVLLANFRWTCSFSCPLNHFPSTTPCFVEHINISCSYSFFIHIDHFSLYLILFLLLTYFFWKIIISCHLI